MVFVIEKSDVGGHVHCTAVNDAGTFMAAVGLHDNQVRIYTREHANSSWVPSAARVHTVSESLLPGDGFCSNPFMDDHLIITASLDCTPRNTVIVAAAGEAIEHMAWGHPQFGNVLAAATNMGRVLILSNRPGAVPLEPCKCSPWRICCTLPECGTPSYKRRVT